MRVVAATSATAGSSRLITPSPATNRRTWARVSTMDTDRRRAAFAVSGVASTASSRSNEIFVTAARESID